MDRNQAIDIAVRTGQLDVRPRFEVEKLDGNIRKRFVRYRSTDKPIETIKDDDGNIVSTKTKRAFIREETEELVPAGYIVYTARGDSFHIQTKEQLQRLGLATSPGLVDMETGESIPDFQPTSLKHRAQARAGTVIALEKPVTGGKK